MFSKLCVLLKYTLKQIIMTLMSLLYYPRFCLLMEQIVLVHDPYSNCCCHFDFAKGLTTWAMKIVLIYFDPKCKHCNVS